MLINQILSYANFCMFESRLCGETIASKFSYTHICLCVDCSGCKHMCKFVELSNHKCMRSFEFLLSWNWSKISCNVVGLLDTNLDFLWKVCEDFSCGF